MQTGVVKFFSETFGFAVEPIEDEEETPRLARIKAKARFSEDESNSSGKSTPVPVNSLPVPGPNTPQKTAHLK